MFPVLSLSNHLQTTFKPNKIVVDVFSLADLLTLPQVPVIDIHWYMKTPAVSHDFCFWKKKKVGTQTFPAKVSIFTDRNSR